ncbi:MAG: CPBP family intramembrane metalloprotease [Candidatus Kapabacteria bacterium]|nr:CPBP family intramembrane metalloprotease [Candidatus Kapabacteria bacterium]
MNLWLRIGLYYIMALFFTILIAGVQQESGFTTPETVILPQLGPGIAAALMLIFFKKDRFPLQFSLSGVSFRRYFLVILLPSAALFAIFWAYNLLVEPLPARFPLFSEIPLILAGMFLGAFGEEIGWRGYLQRVLEDRKSRMIAVLVVGALWGLWHVGNFQNGVLYVAYFLLFSTGASGIMAYVLGSLRYNVILAALFHVVLNCGYFVMKAALPDARFMLVNGCVWMLVWGAILAAERRFEQ